MIALGDQGVMRLREQKRSFEQPDRAIHIIFRTQEKMWWGSASCAATISSRTRLGKGMSTRLSP
jgi:hypothetical protein